MIYVSLDIETTTTEPKKPKNILQLAMVIEDTENIKPIEELPYFCCYVKHKNYKGSAYALSMNAWILEILSGKREANHPILTLKEMTKQASDWLDEQLGTEWRHVMSGKNAAGFDNLFLPKKLQNKFIHRTLDPGSKFCNFKYHRPPNTSQLKRMAGLSEEVSHDALEDARDVIRINRMDYAPDSIL